MRILFLLLFTLCYGDLRAQVFDAQNWTYVPIDSNKQKWGDWADPEWLRYFGLDAGDVDRDGQVDVISGRYVYHNPGGDMTKAWKRTVLDDNVDGIFYTDVDNDALADIIAMALPHVYWYEALDETGTSYRRTLISSVPATSHVNSQGFEKADVIAGGKSELLIAGNGNVYVISIPASAKAGELWPTQLIAANTSDEGIGFGDIDGDGDIDLACGRRPEGEGEPTILVWFENPGHTDSPWPNYTVGHTSHPIDRIEIADLDGDGQAEIAMAEERYPGLEPDGALFWFSPQADLKKEWQKHLIVTQYSSNNLDLADIDQDGDIDLLTGEHKGKALELQIWENDGKGQFTKHVIDTGKENHLGAKWIDLDGDGDLDIIGAAWDKYKGQHVWVNHQQKPATKVGTIDKAAKLAEQGDKPFIGEVSYQGAPHFLIKTPKVSYYYDRQGGGFSRIIDRDGNDWVSFKKEPWGQYPASAASAFRGLPNLVWQGEDDGAGHPGHKKCNSWRDGNSIITESKSGKWKWRWSFGPEYAHLEVIKTDPDRAYWFLYEGTPGGKYQPAKTYFGTDSAGPSQQQYDYYGNNLLQQDIRWAYCGTEGSDRVFYLLQLEADQNDDMISTLGNSQKGIESPDGMTVWGFGRNEKPAALLTTPQQFVIGFYPKRIDSKEEHQVFAQYLQQQFLKTNTTNK